MVDRYTKTVLTIIAAALVGLLTQNAIKPSQAQSNQIQKVAICQLEGQGCASLGRPQGGGSTALGLRVVATPPAH
jgi:hypothetical protein